MSRSVPVSGSRLVPRWGVALALVLPAASARADGEDPAALVRDITACQEVSFGSCGALSAAMSNRDAVAKALVAAMKGAPAPTQGRLAAALGLLDARTEVDALEAAAVALADDPSAVDVRVAQARLGDKRAAPALEAALSSTNQRQQLLASGALALLHHAPAAPKLITLLRDPAMRIQAAAAFALGMIGDKSAEEPLLNVAGSAQSAPMARAAALNALAQLRSSKAVPLATLLVDATPRDVARAALRVLAASPEPWAEDAALAALETPSARAEAAEAIVAMKLQSAGVRVLDTAMRDDVEPDERIALHAAVLALRPTGAATRLVQRLQSLPLNTAPDEAVRILRLLPQLKDRTVVADLVPLLRQDNKYIVNHVVFALENLTDKRYGSDEKPWLEYIRQADGTKPKPAATK